MIYKNTYATIEENVDKYWDTALFYPQADLDMRMGMHVYIIYAGYVSAPCSREGESDRE